jgi:hypothetical protein
MDKVFTRTQLHLASSLIKKKETSKFKRTIRLRTGYIFAFYHSDY